MRVRRWTLRVLIGCALCASILVHARQIEGQVVKVVDGDTLDVVGADRRRYRVRIGAIDAPEAQQPHGKNASRNLRFLALRRPVTIKAYKRDANGRTVAQVWVAPHDACPDASTRCARTLDLGLAQLSAGLAWHYNHYASEQDLQTRARYADQERDARSRRAGLWSMRRPVAPWLWRQARR